MLLHDNTFSLCLVEELSECFVLFAPSFEGVWDYVRNKLTRQELQQTQYELQEKP